MIDNKGIGKPDTFDSHEKDWRSFEIKLGNYIAGFYPKAREILKWASEFGEGSLTDVERDAKWRSGDPDDDVADL